MRLAEWFAAFEEQGLRHTRALPKPSRWERLHFRVLGLWPQSVVDRRMEALYLDEQEQRKLRSQLEL